MKQSPIAPSLLLFHLFVVAAGTIGCTAPTSPSPTQRAAAGRLTEANFAGERVPGPASQGLAGDWFIKNDRIRAVIQAPGRAMGPCPWGGNLIDLDLADAPQGDQIGEVTPFLQLGRTVNFTSIEVQNDGADGGPAVLVARGRDEMNDFINIVGIAAVTVDLIPETSRPTLFLGLDATATYTLRPGEPWIEIKYSFHNPNNDTVRTTWGTLTDSGAGVELFHPGAGYGEFPLTTLLLGGAPSVEYAVLQGKGLSYGIIPTGGDRNARGAPFPVAGVVVEIYDQQSFASALGDSGRTLVIPPRSTVERTVVVAAMPGGAGVIEGAVRALKKQARGRIQGAVVAATGEPAAGIRVAVADARAQDPLTGLVATYVTDAKGEFSGELPPGDYVTEAEGEGWRRSDKIATTVRADEATPRVTLTLPGRALIGYRVRDGAGKPSPAKIMVVGAPAAAPDRRFRDVNKDPPPYGITTWLASRYGDSARNDQFDHPLVVAPGRYRVVISRGPEWSRFEQVIDVAAGQTANIDATINRVVDTSGYVACDFHQHAWASPDSPISPAERAMWYLADGAEYLSSSDHDFVFDYAPVIDALGAGDLLDSNTGVEISPFTYGHFIAFPLPVDPLAPNGGAFDWGDGGRGALAPGDIFAGLRKLGAKVIEINHPRAPLGYPSLQNNFDRGVLTFDFQKRTFYSDSALLEVSAKLLGLPEDASLFSPDFNALEVFNKADIRLDSSTTDQERADVLTDNVMRDWMNFLSFGFVVTAVGNSDSHVTGSSPTGIPRTLVRVPDDGPGALAAGVGDEVVRTVSGAAPRDAIVTNGPMLRLAAGPDAKTARSGIGRTVANPGTTLPIHVEAESAEWAPFDTIEIYANATFTIPMPKGKPSEPLLPSLCFSAAKKPSARCQGALGGARPLVITTRNLSTGGRRLEATVDVAADVAQLLGRVRPGASGKDLWLVARAVGHQALFPVVPNDIEPEDVPVADLVAGRALEGTGVTALAFTNPVFVDVDGGGWRAPFAP